MRPIFRARNSAVRDCRLAIACMLLILFPSGCIASSIVGRVMNRSRHQASAGDQVILYSVERNMVEMARTKSGQDGTFRFETSGNFSYLVAVFHQKVSYHTKTMRGTGPVEIPVYDAAPEIAGLRDESNTLFVQPNADTVSITEFFEISNQSNPPRTLAGAKTFSFALPEGAVIDSTVIQPPGTLPLGVNASPCGLRNRYCVAYPIRPGTTRLRAVYHLTQPASAWITLPQRHVVKSVALMIPEPFQLETRTAGVLEGRGTQNGLSMYVTTGALTGQSLAFRFSGSASRAGTPEPGAASLRSTSLPNALAQASLTESVRDNALSKPRSVAMSQFLIAFFASLALLAMIAVGGDLYARRFCRGGKEL
jgi:hypothetical protein